MNSKILEDHSASFLPVLLATALLLVAYLPIGQASPSNPSGEGDPPQQITAAFMYSPSDPVVGEKIQFTDTSKVTKGTIDSWTWRFGDGSSSEERNPSHKYDSKGNYTVKLTVKTEEEEKDQTIRVLYVRMKDSGEDDEPSKGSNRPDDIGDFKEDTDGSFVSFETSDSGIKDHILRKDSDRYSLFQEISIEKGDIYRGRSQGVFYDIMGRDLDIKVYDSSSALIKMRIGRLKDEDERRISFKLGQIETRHEKPSGRSLDLHSEEGRFNSSLLILNSKSEDLSWSMEENYLNLTIQEETKLIFETSSRSFKGEKKSGFDRGRYQEGIAKGEIGGRITIEEKQNGFEEMSVAYSDMNIMGQVMKEKIEVMVSSNTLKRESIVMITLSEDVINISSPKNGDVRLDGEEIKKVKNYSRLVDESSGSGYMIIDGEDRTRMLVKIPGFSTHSIEILESIGKEPKAPTGDLFLYLPVALVVSILIVVSSIFWRSEEDAYSSSIIQEEDKENKDSEKEDPRKKKPNTQDKDGSPKKKEKIEGDRKKNK